MGTMAWTFTKEKLKRYYQGSEAVSLINYLREFIQDIIHSNDVKSYQYYNYRAIKEMVDNYFAGEKRYAKNIDWWLAFEIWRRSLS
jgi:hypothetical protein